MKLKLIPIAIILLLLLFVMVTNVNAYAGGKPSDEKPTDILAELRNRVNKLIKDANALFESQKKIFKVEPVYEVIEKPLYSRDRSKKPIDNTGEASQDTTNTRKVAYKTVEQKAIDITVSLEGGGYAAIAGNFDGQGLSLGAIQWNIGQATLQPLLVDYLNHHSEQAKDIFGEDKYHELRNILFNSSLNEQLIWAGSINNSANRLVEDWRLPFIKMCQTKDFQLIQRNYMQDYINNANQIVNYYNLVTERGFVLAFDIAVQNGNFVTSNKDNNVYRRQLIADATKNKNLSERELLAIIADAVAKGANPRWHDDVLSRKMAVVNGSGIVHKTYRDFENEYGLSDAIIKY